VLLLLPTGTEWGKGGTEVKNCSRICYWLFGGKVEE